MYFDKFPVIYYTYEIGGKDVLRTVRDVTANVRMRKEVLEGITTYESYDIAEGETPEVVAANYYGVPSYHWAIMLANEIYDYREDWPLSSSDLNSYIDMKYNRFRVESWTYDDKVVTATIPGHGITLGNINDITVDNVSVVIDGSTVFTNALSDTMSISAVTEDTVTFRTKNTIAGTPAGGFDLYTKYREQDIRHYELNGFIVNDNTLDSTPVTHYDYEVSLNDAKRRIKLIAPRYVAQIADELKDLIGS
jgi:hypothetical protein